MPDYKEMYKTLFHSQTKAIEILQQAQRVTEELYISSEVHDIKAIKSNDVTNNSYLNKK